MARKLDRRQALKGGLVVAGGAAFAPAALEALTTLGESTARAAGITPWPEADLILNCIQLPQIPQGLVVNILDHGAVGNGTTDCTAAIAAAISACNAAGGGQV